MNAARPPSSGPGLTVLGEQGPVASHLIDEELARRGLPGLPEPLPGPVADDHTHLDAVQEISGLDPEFTLAASECVGVTRVVQVGCDVASSQWALDFAQTHDQVVAGVAVHPNDAARLVEREGDAALDAAIGRIAELAGHERVRAVGETGLDYFRTRDERQQAIQRRAFAAHIELAKATGRTLVIHDRDAHEDVLAVLDAEGWPRATVLHCFSGDAEFARACLDHGAWLSFGGSITFKPNEELRRALAATPADRILVETDAPYLTPVPLRGRPNAPYLVAHTLRWIAHLHRGGALAAGPQVPRGELEEWCRQIDHNTDEAYGGHWGPAVGSPDHEPATGGIEPRHG